MNSKLIAISIFVLLLQGCNDGKKDKYMCSFEIGMENWTSKIPTFKKGARIGILTGNDFYNYSSRTLDGTVVIGGDKINTHLELNDDTLPDGDLRRIKLQFSEQINFEVYDYLRSLYGEPINHSFELGHPLLKEIPNDKSIDTAIHVWTWKSGDLIVQHLLNVYPPKSWGTGSYIEYKNSSHDKDREKYREEVIKNLTPGVVDVKLRLEYYDYKFPAIEVFCEWIRNNDVSVGRYVTSIVVNAIFRIPNSKKEIHIPNIRITPTEPIPWYSGTQYESPFSVYQIMKLNELRPQYQSVVKAISLIENVEGYFNVVEVSFSDGTILKDK